MPIDLVATGASVKHCPGAVTAAAELMPMKIRANSKKPILFTTFYLLGTGYEYST
jgi:hypothetical protein